jgi:hypothetical protein
VPGVIPGGNFLNVNTTVALLYGARHCGVCFGNPQGFLALGAI